MINSKWLPFLISSGEAGEVGVQDTVSLQEDLSKQVLTTKEETVQLGDDVEGVSESSDPSSVLLSTLVTTPKTVDSTSYLDIQDASILLRRNTSYLVLVSLQANTTSIAFAGRLFGIRINLDGVAIDESEQNNRFNTGNPGHFYTYAWADIVTIGESSQELTVQGKVTNAADELTVDQLVITAIPLTGLTVETDFWIAERLDDDSLTTGNTDGATKTFTPATDDNWLILSSAQVEATNTTNHQFSDLVVSGAISRTLRSRLAFRDTGEVRLHELRTAIVGSGASVTITEKSGSITANAHERLHSKLIGIRLSAFESHAFALTTGSVNLDLATLYGTTAQTLVHTSPSVKRAVILGFALKSSNGTGHGIETRIQVEDVDALATVTDDQYKLHHSTSFSEDLAINVGAVTSVPTGEFTIDLDMSAEASAPPVVVSVEHRLLVVILFEDSLEESLILQEKLTKQVIKGLGETVDLTEPGAELAGPLVLVVSEVRAITARGNNHRVFVSQDNGKSWKQRYLLASERGAVESRLLARDSRSFFLGDTVYPAPGWYPEAGVSVIDLESFPVWLTRWTAEQINAVPDLNINPWRIYDFSNLGGNHLVAVGERMLGGYQLIHSFDAGETWQDPVEVPGTGGRALASLAVGSNLLVGGVHDEESDNSVVAISDDGGQTFDAIELLSEDGLDIETITAIGGSGIVLIGGGFTVGFGQRLPKLFRSTDSGQTYTDVTSGIASLGVAQAVTCIVDVGDGKVALALSGSPSSGHLYFRSSNDSGLTFPVVGSYDPTPVGVVSGIRYPQARSGVLAEDGSVTFGITRGSISAVVEMWRGIIGDGEATWARTAEYFHTQFSGSFMEASLVRLSDPSPVEFPEPPVEINCPDFFDYRFRFTITSPQQGKEWLEKEILHPMGMYPVILSDGRLSIRRFKKRT